MARFKGFRNRETHTFYTWFANDRELYQLMKDAKKKSKSDQMAAHAIKQTVISMTPKTTNLFQDLIAKSIEAADWEEIAREVS